MKHTLMLALCLLACGLFISCGGNEKKNASGNAVIKELPNPDDNVVPSMDTARLKDEPAILAAMQKVVDARLADDKKKNDDPSYAGHYLELTKLYTTVLNAATAYSKTLSDPEKALEFDKKVTTIQDKMYAKP